MLDLNKHIPYKLAVLSNTIRQTTTDVFVKGTGMSPREWRVLAIIGISSPVTSVRIKELTGMDAATITRANARLIELGFVQKTPNPNDGRSTLLTLTDKGKDKFELLMPKMQASGQHYRQALSEGEAILLLELIEKLQNHAELLLNQEG
ncbi:MarR family winged helix-turn-helix transcriptional regulator [Pleionea sp. CnH1-48]|uniref:MarR family winged helix-turn-helix transcriptional regulator n=1 Tax=Pleionea sp. CnH1-48 TaxID=2954494 RepID=UPI00209698BC|nr:SMC-Scp complex subunit ScpB [Pleionea sp. CnH1-48]MCO7225328.1 SMC-Scp complex subunit ScpB [Pleionea sp. CnH1-48]